MIYKLSDSKCIFAFSKNNSPVLQVPSGAVVEIDTRDCYDNQMQTQEDDLNAIDTDRANPATGPVYVQDAKPGDVLKVTIEEIRMKNRGIVANGKGMGPLGDLSDKQYHKYIPVNNGEAQFDSKLSIPINPMVGVIGVANAEKDFSTFVADTHGGNMDNPMVTTGAVLYFPIQVEGALFGLGDIHAAMGDGEIGGTGVEIPGTVRVKLEVLKHMKLDFLVLEDDEYIATYSAGVDIDSAAEKAILNMSALLTQRTSLKVYETGMLMSLIGHVRMCQIVIPEKRTVRFLMPKWALEKYDFKL